MERINQGDLEKQAQNLTQPPSTNDSASERQKCSRCGRMIKALPRSLRDPEKGFFFPPCDCHSRIYDQEQEEKRLIAEQAKYDRMYGLFEFPDRFKNRRIENFNPDAGSEEAYQAVKRYTETLSERLGEGAGFCLYGPNGNGKTHLGVSAYHAARENTQTVVFAPFTDLLQRIRATWKSGKDKDKKEPVTESALMVPLCSARLLILDDVGQEKPSDWVRQQLFEIINSRYEARRSIIVTTNRTPFELAEHVGKASFDRLTEMCQFLEITSESKRFDLAPTW